MKLQLEIAGVLLIGLALLHAGFPRYFRWREQLASLDQLHREIYIIHTIFIALAVFLMGLLALTQAEALLASPLGRRVSLGLFAFWVCRLLFQFFGYSSKLWKGKPFETVVHLLFSLLWIYLSTVFLLAGIQ